MIASRPLKILAIVAVLFGMLTVFSGGRALFGSAEAQASVGQAVGFVLWFNFLAGFAYALTGALLWQGSPLARSDAIFITLATATVASAFGVHVMRGGAYEMRTVGALALRLGFWVVVITALVRARSGTLRPGPDLGLKH